MNKIRQTSLDKVRGKLVKYRLGDCFSIKVSNKMYLGAIMTGKFNAFYNLTFMDFCPKEKPTISDFESGQFFGTRFGSWEDLTYGVDQRMVECKYIDENSDIEKIGALNLIPNFISAGYAYLNDIDEIFEYYANEMQIRIEKTKNAEKFPEIAFVSKHLVYTKHIVNCDASHK